MSITSEFKIELLDQYQDYINTVSQMAPSMKTITLLLYLCVPGYRVLDLGSGFSSYALRYYANRLGIEVWSVDDNHQWLLKTREYCIEHNASSEGFLDWETALYNAHLPYFDVVFVDIGTTKNRPKYYSTILECFCTDKTLILFDDMHKPTLKRAVEQELKAYNFVNIGVMDQTIDEFGRYCKLIFRLRSKQQGV